MVLISYDVATSDTNGKTRLRKVAKECQNHAQRVQNSVFEADLDYSTFLKLKNNLINMSNTPLYCHIPRGMCELKY